MFSISQTSNGFHCIEWSSTEDGPLIVNHKLITEKFNVKDQNTLSRIVSLFHPKLRQETKSMSISLHHDNYLISEIKYDKELGFNYFLSWYKSKILNKSFIEKYDQYYYPLLGQNSYLVLSINKKIKQNLLLSSENLGYNLLYLTMDIFSVATGLKQFYKFRDGKDFLIWKVGKNNIHYILLCNSNGLKCYAKFKKSTKRLDAILKFGAKKYVDSIYAFLNATLFNKKNSRNMKSVFIYQTSTNSNKIKKIILNNSTIEVIDFLKVFNVQANNTNLYKYMPYIENGMSFRGIDV